MARDRSGVRTGTRVGVVRGGLGWGGLGVWS